MSAEQQQADEAVQRRIWESRCPHLLARAEAAEAEVGRLRLLLNRVKETERSTSHDDVLVRFSNQDWDEIREWALAE